MIHGHGWFRQVTRVTQIHRSGRDPARAPLRMHHFVHFDCDGTLGLKNDDGVRVQF
jgi:hypothetical protein